MTMILESDAFGPNQRIPVRFTCDGDDLSPPLRWSGVPDGTRSLALLCDDPDAPAGTWHHWAIFDVPSATTHLAEDQPESGHFNGLRQAMNDFRRPGYGGPCPPPGHGTHRYRFRLLALDVARLEVSKTARCHDVATAAAGHILAEAALIGVYSR